MSDQPDIEEDENLFEKQKFFANRLFQKLDYHKSNRIRIPALIAVANFALLKLFANESDIHVVACLAITMLGLGCVGYYALRTIRQFFAKNIDELDYLYEQMGMKTMRLVSDPKTEMAEHAAPIWKWLEKLVILFTAIPLLLLLGPKLSELF